MSFVGTACSDLRLPVFEWSIADGLVRCGIGVAAPVLSAVGSDAGLIPKTGMGNASMHNTAMDKTADPAQALANLETMALEAVFVLYDFHRHTDTRVVMRRLRDMGQNIS